MKKSQKPASDHGRVVTSRVFVSGRLPRSARPETNQQRFSSRFCRHMLDTAPARKAVKRRRPSILLVDDDVCSRELIKDIFRYDGIPADLVTAASAEEGLAIVNQLQPMLILMDLELPGMDGIEAARRIKADQATEHIPIWAVTGLNRREDIERGLDAGCDGYVTKPIRRSELVFRLLSLWDEPVRATSNVREQSDSDDFLGSDYWIS